MLGSGLALCVAVLGCSDDPGGDQPNGSGGSAGASGASGSAGAAGGSSSLQWGPCEAFPGEECATLSVPRHWDSPAGERIDVRLLRIPATNPEQRVGSLITHLAGAGAGVDVLMAYRPFLSAMFPELSARFDVIAFDRRGFGGTATFECVDDAWVEKLRKTRMMPETTEEWAAVDAVWKEYNDRCGTALSPRGWIDSDQVARDVDAIREALGESMTTFLSTGYSGLAQARNAALFPERLRASAIDAPVPAPEADVIEWYRKRAPVYDALLGQFFERCAADASCAFHGGTSAQEVTQAYDDLAAAIRATPLDVGGRTLGDRDFVEAVGRVVAGIAHPLQAKFDPMVTTLAQALAAAEAGDGAKLLALADDTFSRRADGTYLVSRWSAFPGLVLADHVCPAGFDVTAAAAVWAELQTTAPRLGAVMLAKALVCLHGQSTSQVLSVPAKSAPSLLLVGGAQDPVAPLEGAQSLATALDNGSAVVEYSGYGGTYVGRSACVRESISKKLLEPSAWTAPASGACP
jgi:pimeloyl-ACP methyl ester carboxylesterase